MGCKPRNISGEMITDEAVGILNQSGALYEGYLDQMTDAAISGSSSSTYGIWSAVSKGGTRYDVVINGDPVLATEIGLETATGRLTATTSRTVYVRYMGYGSVPRLEDLLPPRFIYIPQAWGGSPTDWIICSAVQERMKFQALQIEVHQTAPTAQTDIYLRSATGGGGNGDYVRLEASETTAIREFASDLVIEAGEKLVVRVADGNGLAGITLGLYPYVKG